MDIGLFNHLLHFVFCKAAGSRNGNPLLFACRKVLCRNIQDAVGIYIKCNFNLRHTPRRRGNARKVEPPQRSVVPCHLSLALEHMYFNLRLIIRGCCKDLLLFCRYSCIPVYQLCHHTAKGLNTEGERRNIKQDNLLNLAGKNPRLYGRTNSNNLIRVHTLVRFLAKEFLNELMNLRHPYHAAHKNRLVYIRSLKAGIH